MFRIHQHLLVWTPTWPTTSYIACYIILLMTTDWILCVKPRHFLDDIIWHKSFLCLCCDFASTYGEHHGFVVRAKRQLHRFCYYMYAYVRSTCCWWSYNESSDFHACVPWSLPLNQVCTGSMHMAISFLFLSFPHLEVHMIHIESEVQDRTDQVNACECVCVCVCIDVCMYSV